ncbi:sugar phosphate isomerase/epimerase family protein [Desulfococcus sp.]|uniref:sugar phosphate isomerase/epimerase family protein n=1 Tax=Desulfococcus sp. TaxID=2025834 RepID=UPI003593EA42
MVLAYSSNAFVKHSLADTIENVARLGFKGIEIMCDKPHLYPPDFTDDDLAGVGSALEKCGLKATNLNCFTLFAVGDTYLPSWIEADASRREIRVRHTLDCLKVASRLGCGCISVPPGGPLDGMDPREAVRLFREGLDRVLPEAEASGVTVLIEPEPDLLIENTAQFKSFMKEMHSPNLGLNFDIGHFYCVGEDPAAAFEELFRWIGHVHIEDIADTRVHQHLVPGRGAIPFISVFKAMKRLGYEGDICLELYPYVDMPALAGREGLAYLTPIFQDAGLSIDGIPV